MLPKFYRRLLQCFLTKDNVKTVNMPIKVPSGHYCWEQFGNHEICGHFSNEGGHPKCSLGFWEQSIKKDGFLKDPKCDSLVEAIEEQANSIPDYRLSFGGNLSLELEQRGYKRCGDCTMDNGKTGVVYRRSTKRSDVNNKRQT